MKHLHAFCTGQDIHISLNYVLANTRPKHDTDRVVDL